MDITIFGEELQGDMPAEEAKIETIVQAFEKVKDRRKRRGKRYPLALLLTLLMLGKMAGERTVSGVVDWVQERKEWLKKQLDWPKAFPVNATYTQVLAQCDAEEVRQVIMRIICQSREEREKQRSVQSERDQQRNKEELKHTAMDGKALRGTQKHRSENQPPVHLLSLYECETGILIGQQALEQKKNEITGAKAFLHPSFLKGRIVTTDAMHTQKEWCAGVQESQGYYFSVVKKNQRKLHQALVDFFARTENDESAWQYTQQKQEGHGREELREIWASTQMNSQLGQTWKGIAQVCKIRRTVKQKGKEREEVIYKITNLPREEADVERLLELDRKHWFVENRLHYRQDRTLGEDDCQVRIKHAPQVLAALNGGILALMDYLGVSNVASQMRHFCAKPEEAVRLLLDVLPQ